MDTLHAANAMMGAEDSGRTAMYGAFLAGVPALYWETTHAAGGNLEYGVAMQRLMAHCGLISAGGVLPPPAIGDEVQSQGRTVRRMFHENTGHGAGLMSSHNQFPCDGFWRPTKRVWDTIEEGEVLGVVVNMFGETKAVSRFRNLPHSQHARYLFSPKLSSGLPGQTFMTMQEVIAQHDGTVISLLPMQVRVQTRFPLPFLRVRLKILARPRACV